MKEGRKVKRLGEVCEVMNGGTPKTKEPKYWGGPHAWITPAEMGKRRSSSVKITARTLTEEGLAHSSAKLIPPQSVILSTRAPIGYVVVNLAPMAFNQGCRGLIPDGSLENNFLYYFLLARRDLLNSLGTGTTFKELSATQLKSVQISLPPLPEQKRIVAILDESFAAIDKAIANTEKNLANARELFESELNRMLSPQEDGWQTVRLGDVCSFENGDRGKNYPSQKAYVTEGLPFVNAGHLSDGAVTLEGMNYIPKERYNLLGSGKFSPGDILFCLRGSLGKFGIVGAEIGHGGIASSLVIVRPKPKGKAGNVVSRNFLKIYFRSAHCANMIEKFAGGTAQPNLGARDLSRFTIPLPALPEQDRFVEALDQLGKYSDQLQSNYELRLAHLQELKQSLLHKAFTGELTSASTPALEEQAAV